MTAPQHRVAPVASDDLSTYAFLSDCRSAALVDRAGSIDWWSPARFDAPSVLGRLLDPDAGHWSLRTEAPSRTSRAYVDGTLVLRSLVETADGEVEILDALAFAAGARGHEIGLQSPRRILRQVTGRRGVVAMQSEAVLRPEYGRITPYLRRPDGGDRRTVTAVAGPVTLTMTSDVDLDCADDRISAQFSVSAGDRVAFALSYEPTYQQGETPGAASIDGTIESWQSWAEQHQRYEGRYADLVRRHSIVLQGLTFQRSGAVIAAATTSLPEQLGGERNYDYRYSWLRDFALTMRALWVATCPDETIALMQWVARATGQVGAESIPVMYAVEGERDLSEHELLHLRGYAGSRPVRVGNAAWEQRQHDVLGEVLDAAYLLRKELDGLDAESKGLLIGLADKAAADWMQPDAGIWESRDEGRHYVSSKVLCWVALDRAIRLAPLLDAHDRVDRWSGARDAVRRAVLERAWSSSAGAYAGAFGSDDLDASLLLLPLAEFLPATDERMRATIAAIEDRLAAGDLLRRFRDDPAGFTTCSFWLAECLALAGDHERATKIFERTASYANDVGIFTEQADPDTRMPLGNLPQALCHVGLINAAWRLDQTDPAGLGTKEKS